MENMDFAEQVKVEQQRNPEVMVLQMSLQQTSRAELPLL